jgi:hypothetical protein
MRILNFPAIEAGDAGGNITGAAFDASSLFNCSAQVVAAATQLGTVKLQFSNDPVTDINFVTNWSDLAGKTSAVSGAAVGSIEKFDVSYAWMRAVYTATSGTGVLTVNIKANGV